MQVGYSEQPVNLAVRVAGGLGPLVPMGSLAALMADEVSKPLPPFLETIAPIAAAELIPDVMTLAEVTLASAKDAKTYGKLKGDPLSVEGVAFIMKYSVEDSKPALYADMNNRCYDPKRSKIMPYRAYMVGVVKHMKFIEPYPNCAVFRGVKADLKAQYAEGREVTWYGFCSTTKTIGVLSEPLFCGESGTRTIFTIRLTQGQARDITRYSLIPGEGEVLLPPG